MQSLSRLFIFGLFLVAACSSVAALTSFPIAKGPLSDSDLTVAQYSKVGLAANVFEVINQDLNAANNTGLAGVVEPMPVEILSKYAAEKFRATGGAGPSRFVIQQAQLQVRSITDEEAKGWFDSGLRAEISVTVNALLTGTRPDGGLASITATTTQSAKVDAGLSAESALKAYMEVMGRVLDTLDAELTRQIPVYFDGVAAR